MKNHKSILLICLIAQIAVLCSCGKKTGCTESEATNFCAECESDENDCEFSGQVIFWYGKTAKDSLENAGATTVSYFVEDVFEGSATVNFYFTGEPECGNQLAITVTRQWEKEKVKSFKYQIKDQNGKVLWSGNTELTANICTKIQLVK